MAMDAGNKSYLAGRMDELQKENDTLREQLRRLSAQATVARGAITEASAERETTARLAHQVVSEERATRAAVEVAGNSIGMSMILHIVNFFLLLLLAFGLFAWLPQEIANRTARPAANVVVPAGPGTTVIPR